MNRKNLDHIYVSKPRFKFTPKGFRIYRNADFHPCITALFDYKRKIRNCFIMHDYSLYWLYKPLIDNFFRLLNHEMRLNL